jgi:hypothetical protein
MTQETEFRNELQSAINRASKENGSNTPDFILAEYLSDCLTAFDKASVAREGWYGRSLSINGVAALSQGAHAPVHIVTTPDINKQSGER